MILYIDYVFKGATVLLLAAFLVACEEEEVNDAVPDFPPLIGINSGSVPDVVTEGETVALIAGIFSDRSNDQTVTVDWVTSGAVVLSGQLTIEPGTKVDTAFILIPENTVANDTGTVTFTLSNITPNTISFVPEDGRESVTFNVVDDVKVLSVTTDTLAATESDGVLSVPIRVSGTLDEGVQVAYTVTGTAVEGVDYALVSPSPVTISADDEEPSVDIRLLNNSDLQAERTLEVNVIGVTSTNEEVSLSTGSGSVLYNLSDDTKTIRFGRLDVATPVAEDTLTINTPGTYELIVEVGGSLLSEVTVEINNTGLPTGVNLLVSNPFTLVPDEDTRPYSFTVTQEALDNLTADAFFSFTLENITALNGDNEVILEDGTDEVLVQLVASE